LPKLVFQFVLIFVFKILAGQARSGRDDNREALVKYCIFAWTTSAVIVIISAILDKTNTVIVGYGELNIN